MPPTSTASADCEQTYAHIRDEFSRRGLDHAAIEENWSDNCRTSNGRAWVKVRAYKPTGLALGCPLPDAAYQRRLWQLTSDAAEFLARLAPQPRPMFAHVPPEFYHVTAVNFTHFDRRIAVRPLGRREFRACQAVIAALRPGAVSLTFRGLLLTRTGRLLVPGHADTPGFFDLRERLLAGVPALRENAPRHAAMKLGHLLAPLDRPQQAAFEDWLEKRAGCAEHRITFTDAHTPLGRIAIPSRP